MEELYLELFAIREEEKDILLIKNNAFVMMERDSYLSKVKR
jgi:hypothetical protein